MTNYFGFPFFRPKHLLPGMLAGLVLGVSIVQADSHCEPWTVQAGESVSKLAGAHLGDVNRYMEIVEATNKAAAEGGNFSALTDPNRIEIGMTLCIPGHKEAYSEDGQQQNQAQNRASDGIVEFIILQVNDVYEISPVAGGKEGGLARLATLKKQLLDENPNTYLFLAGDLFSPSALGTAKVDGVRLDGKHIVDVMNHVGLEYSTIGNHEFDIAEEAFFARIEESNSVWTSANVVDNNGQPFPGITQHSEFTVQDHDGDQLIVGVVGGMLKNFVSKYSTFEEPLPAIKAEVAKMTDSSDFIVALTHLTMAEDMELAVQVPDIDVIMGGHERENIQALRGSPGTLITKADANARTAYIHRIKYDLEQDSFEHSATLRRIDDSLEDDPEVEKVVKKWEDIAFQGFKQQGFEPDDLVTTTTDNLDGREASVRNHETNLSKLIGDGMLHMSDAASISISNSGSIRIDDIIPAGNISQYDVIRVLPFGGEVVLVKMAGSMLKQTLDQGEANVGSGGYLVRSGVTKDETQGWLADGAAIDDAGFYQVAISEFLLTGKEKGLGFLKPTEDNKDQLEIIDPALGDIRNALIDELLTVYGAPNQ